jgi:mannosyltransferase OCH1-like enzyme
MKIGYVAPEHVRKAICSLGRTEDLRFSPSGRRLAVAGYTNNKITVFDISAATSQQSSRIALTDVAEISSSYLSNPHGLDFIDEERILVANRDGQACIFKLPLNARGSFELTPSAIIRSSIISVPGSVAVIKNKYGLNEALICNNYVHYVTRHQLDLNTETSGDNGEVLLRRWIDIPDGICASNDSRWMAVSNHGAHAVLIYENNSLLNEKSNPVGILRGVDYPHGLRFCFDDRIILVADAGSPYVHMYEKDNSDWRGVYNPFHSFRVLNRDDYLRGRHNPEEGGPKGIDVSHPLNVLVSTSEMQPLNFFDLKAVVQGADVESTQKSQTLFSPIYPPNEPISFFRKNLIRKLEVTHQLILWYLKRKIRWKVQSIQGKIKRLTDRKRIAGWLQCVSHPSFTRMAYYFIFLLIRRVFPPNQIGDQKNPSREIEKFLPISNDALPETTSIDEISKIIFQTWKSRLDIPPNYRYWRSTFIQNNPEFNCVLWDDDDNREFIAEKFAWFLPTYNRLPGNIFRADAIRPFFLFLYGGVYADMDTQCLSPLCPQFSSGDVILGQMGLDLNNQHSIPNAIMASKPFQLFWLLFIALIMEKVKSFTNDKDLKRAQPEFLTGPVVLHEAFDLYQSEPEQDIRNRIRTIIGDLPDHIYKRVRAGCIEILPPDAWYPINWTFPFHWRFRNLLLRHQVLLSPADARSLFPKASLVTYWTHSW